MEKNVEFGIKHVKFAPIAAGGDFPDFNDNGVTADLIEVDSFTFEEDDNTTNSTSWEDIAGSLSLPGETGAKRIVFTSNNLSPEAYQFFKGYNVGTGDNLGWTVDDPDSDDSQTLAMQVVTKPIAQYPALIHEFANVMVTTKKTGTLGKNGLPAFSFTCEFQPNFDASGKPIPNHRFQPVAIG